MLTDLADAGFLRTAAIPFLEAMVRGRLNVLVAGGTGTGKTTFARVLCRLVPSSERLVTIEDQAELHLWRELPDCVSLEGRPANIEGRGAIGITGLVHEALRMSPDRNVIGEVRGAAGLGGRVRDGGRVPVGADEGHRAPGAAARPRRRFRPLDSRS